MKDAIMRQDGNRKQVNPVWVRVDEVTQQFGIKKTKLYELIQDNKIQSVSMKNRGQIRGIRLINYDSMCDYLNSLVDRKEVA